MVNFEVMDLLGNDPDSNILFKTMTHMRFFNIVLVDFLSTTDPKSPVQKKPYLTGLGDILSNPKFNVDGSINFLKHSIEEFQNWLEQVVEVEVWLPTIEKNVKLNIKRFDFIKMTGNISKHNFLRLGQIAEMLRKFLATSGIAVDINKSMLLLPEFYERFHTDIFNYHGSTIAEYLNNIRWGIYEYLQPEFQKSIICEEGNPPKYRYTYPEGVKSEFAKACYWDLMNEIRNPPCVRKFNVTKYLKLSY